MKKLPLLSILTLLAAGCVTPEKMLVRVAPLGEPVPESGARLIYMLPRTVLKIEAGYREIRHIPGPYRDFAERYLGITEVIRNKYSQWEIVDLNITPFTEADPGMLFHVNQLEGDFHPELLFPWLKRGMIVDGTASVNEQIRFPGLESGVTRDYETYADLGMESNFAERTETMYKTIVTDTSFVDVPVSRTIMEQKSLSKKAEEAADLILELRSRRFELLTGGYDVIPQGEAMDANLRELDRLEQSYLSLFTGKTYSIERSMGWFLLPEAGQEGSSYDLGHFSLSLGFVPGDLREGSPLEVVIEPQGTTRDLEAFYAGYQSPDNTLLYRLPDIVKLQVKLGDKILTEQRLSVFQSGALVAAPL